MKPLRLSRRGSHFSLRGVKIHFCIFSKSARIKNGVSRKSRIVIQPKSFVLVPSSHSVNAPSSLLSTA